MKEVLLRLREVFSCPSFPTVQANNADCLFLLAENHFLDERTEGAAHESTGLGRYKVFKVPLHPEVIFPLGSAALLVIASFFDLFL